MCIVQIWGGLDLLRAYLRVFRWGFLSVCVCVLWTRVWQRSDSCPLLGCKPFCAQCGQTAHSSIWKMLTLLIKGQTRVIMISLCWEGWDVEEEERRGWRGEWGARVSVGRRACQTIADTHTLTHRRSCFFSFSASFKGATQICIILRVLNFQSVSFSYFNKETNQCWFGSSAGALLRLWHSISHFYPLSLSGFSPTKTRQREKKRKRMKTGEEYDGGLDDFRRKKGGMKQDEWRGRVKNMQTKHRGIWKKEELMVDGWRRSSEQGASD